MNKLRLYTTHLYGQLRDAWRNRRMYRTRSEAWRALGLRLVAIRSLRRLASPGRSLLHLRDLDRPLYVRRATSDFWVMAEIFEDDEYAAVKRLQLPADASIIDLGANIGLASQYFATLFRRCRIIAVEPDQANCEMIGYNCPELLDQGRLHVVKAFVAAHAGAAVLDRSFDSYGFVKRDPAGQSPEELVECVTMDRLIERLGCDSVDLVKCDIEGTEAELFAACGRWIGRIRNMIVETHEPYSLPDLYAQLRAAGWHFDVVWESTKPGRSLTLLRHANKGQKS